MEASGKRHILHGSRTSVFDVGFVSDIHYGARACVESKLYEIVDTIKKDKHRFFILGGDLIDCISYADTKRFDPQTIAEWMRVEDLAEMGMVASRRLRDIFDPIRHQCLGICTGNHEYQYQRRNQQNIHGWLCNELQVPSLAYSAMFDLVFLRRGGIDVPSMSLARPDCNSGGGCSQSFRVFVHHGSGGSTTPGGKLNRLTKFMNDFPRADIVMMGHVHDRIAHRKVTLDANAGCDEVIERVQIGTISGALITTYNPGETTYGERAGYSPVTLGPSWVRIKPETRELTAEV